VAGHFAKDGLPLAGYLRGALKMPSLFASAPATIIRHVNCIIDMHLQGFLTFPGQEYATPQQPLLPLFTYLVKHPRFLILSDENYALRLAYARIPPAGMSLLTQTRHRIERALRGTLDGDLCRPA